MLLCRGAPNTCGPAKRLCSEVEAMWGSMGTLFLQDQPSWNRTPCPHWPSKPGQEAAGTAGLQVCHAQGRGLCLVGLAEEACKPTADTAAEPGPTSTCVLVPGQHLPKPTAYVMGWSGNRVNATDGGAHARVLHVPTSAASLLRLWGLRMVGT